MNAIYSLMGTHTFLTPQKILFGENSSEGVGLEAKIIGANSVFLITDKAIEKAGLADKVRSGLERNGLDVKIFDGVEPEPSIDTAEEASDTAKKGHFDLIVGLGGGSVLDVAKTTSAMAANPGEVRKYFTGEMTFGKRGLPLVLLPTTAGTGSEVTDCAVLHENAKKKSISTPIFLADVAIVDPLFTITLPAKYTASCGLDALCHAIESILSLNSNRITEALGLEAARLISNNLELACAQGKNFEGRYNLSLAASMAGLALNSGVVAAHYIGEIIGPRYKIPHGTSCALSLPYIMEYNLPACKIKLGLIYDAISERNESNLTLNQKASKAIEIVKRLIENLNMPISLQDVGVSRDELLELTEEYMNFPSPRNPRILTREEAVKLFEAMWAGKVGYTD